MRMKKLGFLITMLAVTSLPAWSQAAKSIRITEVMTDNRTSIVDEYGKHKPWVELSNSSFTTYNVRGMFLTTDRRVLDKNMSPEERRKLMSQLPNNEPRTTLGGKKSIVIFEKGRETGTFQLPLGLLPMRPNWVAIYDGNAVDLIDSVSIPPLLPDQTYELATDFKTWAKANGEEVTPGYLPQHAGLSKSQQLKKSDPYGVGISVLSMGIVFFCLALLFVFFWLFGSYMQRKQQKEKAAATPAPKPAPVPQGDSQEAIATPASDDDMDTYMAVIAMALKQHLAIAHEEGPGILTIKPKHTRWNTTKVNNY